MSSRLSRGSSTKANARLEALLRVIDWLTSAVTAADLDSARLWGEADRRSRPGSDCAGGDRGGGGVSGAGGHPERAFPPRRSEWTRASHRRGGPGDGGDAGAS